MRQREKEGDMEKKKCNNLHNPDLQNSNWQILHINSPLKNTIIVDINILYWITQDKNHYSVCHYY